jgi:hypothetical protein
VTIDSDAQSDSSSIRNNMAKQHSKLNNYRSNTKYSESTDDKRNHNQNDSKKKHEKHIPVVKIAIS